jgi:hypothetical protein
MLKAYIDGSGDGGPVLVLAGYVATAEQWAPFADDWDAKLKEAGLSRFKMSEMVSRPEIAGWFYRSIEEHVSAALACAVPRSPLHKVVRELGLGDVDRRLTNPYYFSVKAIINMTAQHQKKMGFHEPIDFIFDDQSEKQVIRDAWDTYLQSPITPEVKEVTGAEPQFLKDDGMPPLQAADLFAWWMRIQWEKHGTLCREQLPFPWPLKRDIPRLMMEFDEVQIEAEIRKIRQALVERGVISATFTGLDGRKS